MKMPRMFHLISGIGHWTIKTCINSNYNSPFDFMKMKEVLIELKDIRLGTSSEAAKLIDVNTMWLHDR